MPRVSTFTGASGLLPEVEQTVAVKSVGLSGTSKLEERIEVSDISRNAIRRDSDIRSLTRLNGPNPKLRLIGPAPPSNVTSKFSKSSETDPHTLSRPAKNRRPSCSFTHDGQPRLSDQSPISQSAVA